MTQFFSVVFPIFICIKFQTTHCFKVRFEELRSNIQDKFAHCLLVLLKTFGITAADGNNH